MIEVWGRGNAYNVQKVLWTLAELKLEYTQYELGSLPGELDTPEFLALNPHARIPVLRQEDAIVWESNSIIRYLSACHSHDGLWPDDVFQRSCAERWMDWELAKLQPDFIALFWGYYRTLPDARDQESIGAALMNCTAHFQQLDRQLEQQPVGDQLCVHRQRRRRRRRRWHAELRQQPGRDQLPVYGEHNE